MEKLPQEIYDRILIHISPPPDDILAVSGESISDLATISKPWQRAVECRNFQLLKISNGDLSDFEKIVVGIRRQYLQGLWYKIALPAYDLTLLHAFERESDRTQNDLVFSKAIHGLFNILVSWERGSDCQKRCPMELCLSHVSSPTDPVPLAGNINEQEESDAFLESRVRHRYSYLVLHDTELLPSVHGIQGLSYFWEHDTARRIHPKVVAQLLDKLPELDLLDAISPDVDSSYPAFRRMIRDQIASSFQSVQFPKGLRDFAMHMRRLPVSNQTWEPESLLSNGVTNDRLSSSLWKATSYLQDLTSFRFEGILDSSLVWPAHLNTHYEPFWQNLRHLSINFELTSPSGHWYFHSRDDTNFTHNYVDLPTKAQSLTAMPPGYTSTEQEDRDVALSFSLNQSSKESGERPSLLFRLAPNEPVLYPLIESFARACQQIPHLQTAYLETRLSDWVTFYRDFRIPYDFEWGIYFAVPGYESAWANSKWGASTPEEDLSTTRLSFNTPLWRPESDLHQLLREIGNCNENLVEIHLDLWESVFKEPYIKLMRKRHLHRGTV